jgi:hypothetical protein
MFRALLARSTGLEHHEHGGQAYGVSIHAGLSHIVSELGWLPRASGGQRRAAEGSGGQRRVFIRNEGRGRGSPLRGSKRWQRAGTLFQAPTATNPDIVSICLKILDLAPAGPFPVP